MTTITLTGSGKQVQAASGQPLRDVLFPEGVEFPCGGQGRCKGCRVRVVAGAMAATNDDRSAFSDAELRDGWRLACRHDVEGDITLAQPSCEISPLGDDSAFVFTPRDGFGIAVDLGTTTIAAQLLDLRTGHVLGFEAALNTQARYGADVLARAAYALTGGASELTRLIRNQIGTMIATLAPAGGVSRIVVAGNSAMHHLFGGLDLASLATHPFLPTEPAALTFTGSELGWASEARVDVLPCIGGLVGGDVLAGVAATGLAETRGLAALIDLGTNGEVVVAQDGQMICTSTAAGPAFEGARISHGMRAASGAIDAVAPGPPLRCRVIGGGGARGLCGSGLVDAVAAGLDLGLITRRGQLKQAWTLADDIVLTPQDVRELQLAKGAIAAGLRLLTAKFGATPADIGRLYLAGAFGNAVSQAGAARIGLIRTPIERIVPAGNTALKGAKQALFGEIAGFDALAKRIGYIGLAEEPAFAETFAEEMGF